MLRKSLILLVILVIIFIAVVVVWKYVFKNAEVSVGSKKAEIRIEAAVLVKEYENDEETANSKYLGKIIEVSGTVNSINEDEQGVSVYLKNKDDISGVMCTFDKNTENIKRINTGDQATIKGVCDGYLMDVKLNKCSTEK